jgi:hypothetical protein
MWNYLCATAGTKCNSFTWYLDLTQGTYVFNPNWHGSTSRDVLPTNII